MGPGWCTSGGFLGLRRRNRLRGAKEKPLSRVLLAAAAALALSAGCNASTRPAAPRPTRAAMTAYEHQYLVDLVPVDRVAGDFMEHFGHAHSVTASEAEPVASAYTSFRRQLL